MTSIRRGPRVVCLLLVATALFMVGGCARSEPQLGVGPNPLIFYVDSPTRAQTFGSLPLCNKSPDATTIVVTGLKLTDPTPGLVVDGWGWSYSFGKVHGLVEKSDKSLSELGFVTKPVVVKMDCQKWYDNPLVLQPNTSPQFAVRMHATGTSDEWSKNGITVTYLQNGTPMESTFAYMYAFCGATTPHDPSLEYCS